MSSPQCPALWVVIAFAVGIAGYSKLPLWPVGYAAIAALAAVLLVIFRGQRVLALVLCAVALAAAGLAWGQMRGRYAPDGDIATWVSGRPMLARVRLRVDEPPVVRASSMGDEKTMACRAQLLAIDDGGMWRPASGAVLLRIAPAREDIRAEQELELIGELSRISAPVNPGEFDWSTHFAREGIYARLSVDRPDVVGVIESAHESVLGKARRVARDALRSGMPDNETAALIQTLIMGDSDDRLQNIWADFRASGTAHHLSISGMHLAIFGGFVVLVGRLLRFHPRNVLLLAVVCAMVYAVIARPSPPVVRSALLCLAIAAAILLRRRTDAVQCLFVGVLAMLIWNPMDLFSPGFQLSAGAVAFLMLVTGSVIRWFWSLENEHERMARVIKPPAGLAAFAFNCKRWLIDLLAAGLVAYSITLPLVLMHFHQVNPWAIPGGILLAPVVGLTLLLGLIKAVICMAIPSAGPWLAAPVIWSAEIMRWGVGCLAHLPGAELVAPPVPAVVLVVYGILLSLPFVPRLRGRRWVWLCPTLAVVAMMLWPLLSRAASPRRGLTVTLLSVDNAACTVVELPDGNNAFIDCGGPREMDVFTNTIQPYLREQGIHTISDVVLTHQDSDHRQALPQIEQAFGPRVWQDVRAHRKLAIQGPVIFEILGPHPLTPHRGNDASTVVRLEYAGRSILFTGDIQEDGIEELLRSGRPVNADVLIAPHHGSCEEATGKLIGFVNPSRILASSSSRLSGKQLRFDRLVESRTALRTGTAGAIRVTILPNGEMLVRTFSGDEWH